MTRMIALVVASSSLFSSAYAHADDIAPVADEDPATRRGRDAFSRGLKLAEAEEWGRAVDAFYEAARARDAAIVQFNIAVCLRALGRYVAARRAIATALQLRSGLTEPQVRDAEGYLSEFDALTSTVEVRLIPATAQLSIDGRALVLIDAEAGRWAPLGDAGSGTKVEQSSFSVALDRGFHVFRATRPGHEDAVVRRSVRPGTTTKLDLDLARLPATLRIQSRPAGAIVVVNGREVGLAPIEVERKAGQYTVEVVQEDFETYTATVDVAPGQRTELTAELEPYSPPLYERWWFWTAAAGVVAGGVVVSWAATRTDPEPPPYNGGTAGWVVDTAVFRF